MDKNKFKLNGYPLLKKIIEKYDKSKSNKGGLLNGFKKPIIWGNELEEKYWEYNLHGLNIDFTVEGNYGFKSGILVSDPSYLGGSGIKCRLDDYVERINIYEIESIDEFNKIFTINSGGIFGELYYVYFGKRREQLQITKLEYQVFEEFINKLPEEFDKQRSIHKERLKKKKKEDEKRFKLQEEEKRIKKEKWLKQKQEQYWKDQKRKEVLKKDISDISKEFDTDSDGIIDFNQGQDDFMNLLKKHQVSIIDIDQNHITKFIQVSNYLKTKRENIQKQFEKIKTSKNTYQLKEFTGVLKNQIDTFNLLSYNSMIMIISLVEKDLLTFNEIYLTLDKLNIFNSNWENEVSNKLENIGSKLDDLMFSINKMEISITNEILKMSIMNQINLNRLNKTVKTVSQGNMMINDSLKSLNSSLSSNLKSIGSKINLNNLLTGINTYQLYTLNKNTKSLRS